jgi:MFS family permease
MHAEKMTSREKHAVMSLSMIMILRMVGLFMVLPVFALYAEQLPGATATLVGLALGIYGLTQALCQIPFGAISDHYGRKPIILAGLLLFSLGSLIAALAHSIIPLIIGRALQGIGAIGSTLLAMIADFTREEQRTKSMAFAGMSIGLSFALAMLIGPLLMKWLSVGELFYLAVIFSLIAIFILYVCVPEAPQATWHRDTEPELKSFINILKEPELIKLNSGIFILHALFTANFIVIPISLQTYNGFAADQQWLIYLPTLIIAFLGSFLCMGIAEKKRQLKRYFIASIVVLGMAELLLWTMPSNLPLTLLGLGLFFGGFSLLEAFLP